MSNVKVTQEQIDDLLEKAIVTTKTYFGKCTVVTVLLENGFVLTESSACVDKENYDESIGYDICINRIKNKLWELEGYKLQDLIHQLDKTKFIMVDYFKNNPYAFERAKKTLNEQLKKGYITRDDAYDPFDSLRYEDSKKPNPFCTCDICDGKCGDDVVKMDVPDLPFGLGGREK